MCEGVVVMRNTLVVNGPTAEVRSPDASRPPRLRHRWPRSRRHALARASDTARRRADRRRPGRAHRRRRPGEDGVGRVDVARARRGVPRADRPPRQARPRAALDPRGEPRRARDCGLSRRRTQAGQGARPAARRAGGAERQHRHRRSHEDHGGIGGAPRRAPAEGRRRRREAARGRRGPAREGQPQRVGEHPQQPLHLGMERARRHREEPVRARSNGVRVELGLRRERGREPHAPRRGHRDGGLHPVSVVDERHRRHQALRRHGQPGGHHSHRAHPRHRGTDGAHGEGRGRAARDPRGPGSPGVHVVALERRPARQARGHLSRSVGATTRAPSRSSRPAWPR